MKMKSTTTGVFNIASMIFILYFYICQYLRKLVDMHGKSQTLQREDIINMRSSGKSEEIVQTLIDKSSSFTSKTAYSQEKYINKKNKKHSNIIQILKLV